MESDLSTGVSKKEIAQEFFRSLDQSEPWKLRLSKTIDHMKVNFPKGQTERVVYQFIKEIIPEADRPNPSAKSLREAVSAKIDGLRQEKIRLSEDRPEWYKDYHMVRKLFYCGDLYNKDSSYNNGNYFERIEGDLLVKRPWSRQIMKPDDAVAIIERIDFSSEAKLSFSEIFPYFDKSILQTPISLQELISLSGDLLTESEVSIAGEAFSNGKTFPKAIEWTSQKIKENFLAEIQNEVSNSFDKSNKIDWSLYETPIKYLIAFILAIGLYSCVKLNEGSGSNSAEDRYMDRCTANGTSRSVCDEWYDEIQESVNDR